MKTALITLGVLLASTVVHAEGLPDRIKTADKVVVANQPNYPPMEYKDPATNTLMGVDIDLGVALALLLLGAVALVLGPGRRDHFVGGHAASLARGCVLVPA